MGGQLGYTPRRRQIAARSHGDLRVEPCGSGAPCTAERTRTPAWRVGSCMRDGVLDPHFAAWIVPLVAGCRWQSMVVRGHLGDSKATCDLWVTRIQVTVSGVSLGLVLAGDGPRATPSCMTPASVASCSGSMVPVALSAPNTGLRQPHEHTACAPPSPTDRTVVWWSTPPLLPVNNRAGHGPLHAGEALDPGDHEPGQLVDVGGLRSGDDIVWSGQAGRLRHARPSSSATRPRNWRWSASSGVRRGFARIDRR